MSEKQTNSPHQSRSKQLQILSAAEDQFRQTKNSRSKVSTFKELLHKDFKLKSRKQQKSAFFVILFYPFCTECWLVLK